MMAVTGSLKNGVLNIKGSKYADNVNVAQANGVVVVAGVGSWSASQVNWISMNLGKGNDVASFDSLANGGAEALAKSFLVTSSKGTDLIHLAGGHDVTLNGIGRSLAVDLAGNAKLDGQALTWAAPSPAPVSVPTTTTSNWFDSHVVDAALRSLGHNLYADGRIDRNDMIGLLRNAEDGGVVDSTELTDLRTITSSTTLFGSFDYVWKLSTYVVSANVANAKYQGTALGNLAAGSTSVQMEKLISKWFLGMDHPLGKSDWGPTYGYRQAAGTLFGSGVLYTDIRQGGLGDCYFLASLAETALKNPSAITSMFIVNGDGTYTVRFMNGAKAEYVTVDSQLPTDSYGRFVFDLMGQSATNPANKLWGALAEKAYVQINECGWIRPASWGGGQNVYTAISGGYMYMAMGQITGQATVSFVYASNTTFDTMAAAFNSGKSIAFGSKGTPANSNLVVGGHAYAVASVNTTQRTVTLFNPWGLNNGHDSGLITLTWAQVQANFSWYDRTA
jgi:hypothetical protein